MTLLKFSPLVRGLSCPCPDIRYGRGFRRYPHAAPGNQAVATTKQFYKIGASWVSKQQMDAFTWNTSAGVFGLTMDGPQQFSLGVALTPRPRLLIEADVKHVGFAYVLGNVAVSRPVGYIGPIFQTTC